MQTETHLDTVLHTFCSCFLLPLLSPLLFRPVLPFLAPHRFVLTTHLVSAFASLIGTMTGVLPSGLPPQGILITRSWLAPGSSSTVCTYATRYAMTMLLHQNT